MKLNRRSFISVMTLFVISPLTITKMFSADKLITNSSLSKSDLKRLRKTLFKNVTSKDLILKYKIPVNKIRKTLQMIQTTPNQTFTAIRNDFQSSKVCIVDGWVLSETEVIICLMT